LRKNPEVSRAFDAGTQSIYTPTNVIGAYEFGRFGSIVDVGGGRGVVLAAILSTNPHVQGVLFDTTAAMAGAEVELARAGVADRCRLVGSDSLDTMPSGRDAYLLTGMIHGLGDVQAVEVLNACRSAMTESSCLLIAETVLPDGGRPSMGKFLDLQTLVFSAGGYMRTEAEYRALLDKAGFRLVRTAPSSAIASVMEAVPS
jgi:hypothetical protein